MKIVLISDTHAKHEGLKDMPEGDMIIHAGDISTRGYLTEIKNFLEWFNKLPYKYRVFIAGNHDFSFEDKKTKIRELLTDYPDIIYLEDEGKVIEGIYIYGSPWTPRFYNWAFNADRGFPIQSIWQRIPQGVDILVTHGPPLGYGDLTARNGTHVGCADLLERILEVKPKLCIFGHIHEGWGMYRCKEDRDITMINASVLDEQYYLINDPVVIDYYNFV